MGKGPPPEVLDHSHLAENHKVRPFECVSPWRAGGWWGGMGRDGEGWDILVIFVELIRSIHVGGV